MAQQPHGVNVTLNFTPWTWWQLGQDGQGYALAPYGAAAQPNVSASAYIDGAMQRFASTNGLAFDPWVYRPARWCQNAASPSPATDQGARPPGLPALRACAPAAAGAARPTLRAARARAARVCRPARGAAPQQLLGRLLRGRQPPGPERERQQLGRLLCGVRLFSRAGLLHGHERRRERHGPVEPLARCARGGALRTFDDQVLSCRCHAWACGRAHWARSKPSGCMLSALRPQARRCRITSAPTWPGRPAASCRTSGSRTPTPSSRSGRTSSPASGAASAATGASGCT